MDLFFKSKLSNDNAGNINFSLRGFVTDKCGVVEVRRRFVVFSSKPPEVLVTN